MQVLPLRSASACINLLRFITTEVICTWDYQLETGIAVYTLIYKSCGLLLVSHEPFESTQKAIGEEKDILSTTTEIDPLSAPTPGEPALALT